MPPRPQTPARPPTAPWRGRVWWSGIAAAVLLHGLVLGWVGRQLGTSDAEPAPVRLEALFTRTLTPQAPPEAPAPPPPAPAPAPRAAAVAAAASAPPPAASAAEPAQASGGLTPDGTTVVMPTPGAAASAAEVAAVTDVTAVEPGASAPATPVAGDPAPAAPSTPTAQATGALPTGADAAAEAGAHRAAQAAAPVASAARSPGFEWPASTRIRYVLTGWFRGEVHGRASVEWLRDGLRYQVHLDVALGPSFAPLMTRRMSSDGEITPRGLRPRRYDEVTTQILGSPRRRQMRFDDDLLTLANGQTQIRPADLQDTASQFVQLVWRFTVEPRLLHPGASVSFPLALPRRVDAWTYDVVARETLPTPIGPVDTWHVKPRRPADPGDLTAEMWFAPTLQTLPARIRIHQDAQTWIQLDLESLPEQAAR